MRKAPLLLLLVVAVVLAAGCGSSKNSAATTAADATTTAAADTTTASADTTATSTTPGKIDLSKADSSCKAMVAFGSQISKAMQGSSASSGGDISKAAANAAKLFAAYVKAAPSEIKPDMQAYADAFTKYAKALAGVHLKTGKAPSASDMTKLTAAAHALASPSLQQHSAHLQAWATKHCGVSK
jgi:hypothetical protein